MKNFSLLFLGFVTLLLSCIPPAGSKYNSGKSALITGKYNEFLEPNSVLLSEGYNYTIEKTEQGSFVEKIYNPDLLVMNYYKTYSDKTLGTQNGLSKSWWDNGDLINEGRYENNLKTKEWKEYMGKTSSVGNYVSGKKEGLWVTRDSSGSKVKEYNFLNGKRNGDFQIWNKKGELAKRGTFINGKRESVEVLIKRKKGNNDSKEVMPMFKHSDCEAIADPKAKKKCAERKMLEFIYTKIKYPAVARENGVQGTAVVQFVIDKDGTITEMKTRRGICKEIQEECERIVSLMGKWEPGIQRGKAVKVQFNLPIRFKLE